MRFIRLYILKYKLAALFTQAEQLSLNGVESGDQRYVELLAQANILIREFNAKHPDVSVDAEVPGLVDLIKLTVPVQPTDYRPMIRMGLIATVITTVGIGGVGAMINVSYHGWMHLFHWLRMV